MQKFREFKRHTIVLLSYQVNEAFFFSKGLYEMKDKNLERYWYRLFVELIIRPTLLLRRFW